MATDTTTATRRGVLVALAGTAAFAGTIGAAIAAPAEAATIDHAAWQRAMTAFQSAAEAMRQHNAKLAPYEAAFHAEVEARGGDAVAPQERAAIYSDTVPDHLHFEADALSDAVSEPERVLLEMPAPDSEALLWKLERLFGEEGAGRDPGGFSDSLPPELVEAFMADARRILSAGRA